MLFSLFLLQSFAKNKILKFLLKIIKLIFIGIYLLQFMYFAYNGEFISTLAIDNIDQLYIFFQVKYIALLVVLILIAIILSLFPFNRVKENMASKSSYNKLISIISILFVLVIYQNIGEYVVNPIYAKYFKHTHKTPVAEFCLNVYHSVSGETNMNFAGNDYAFQKDWV